jgi:hypothetical protein
MILVTPLPVWRLVTGRVRSLWRQFLPAFFCWTLFACFLTPPRYFAEDLMRAALVVFTILLITPGVGMEFAVNVRGHWRAVLATSAVVLVVPGIVFLFALGDSWPATFLCCAILWISGMLITPALQLQMKERRLAFLHPHRRQRHHSRWFPRTGTLRLRAYSAVVRALAPPP